MAPFLYRRVPSSLEEYPDHVSMTLVGSSVQGSGSSLSPSIDVRPVSEQQLQWSILRPDKTDWILP